MRKCVHSISEVSNIVKTKVSFEKANDDKHIFIIEAHFEGNLNIAFKTFLSSPMFKDQRNIHN